MLEFIGDLTYYLTACYGVLNTKDKTFCYSNAGHLPSMHYHHKNKSISRLKVGGPIIGAFEIDEYPESCVKMKSGDGIFLFTDGIVETRNNTGEMFSEPGLEHLLAKQGYKDAERFIDVLKGTLSDYIQEHHILDDRAALYFKLKQ